MQQKQQHHHHPIAPEPPVHGRAAEILARAMYGPPTTEHAPPPLRWHPTPPCTRTERATVGPRGRCNGDDIDPIVLFDHALLDPSTSSFATNSSSWSIGSFADAESDFASERATTAAELDRDFTDLAVEDLYEVQDLVEDESNAPRASFAHSATAPSDDERALDNLAQRQCQRLIDEHDEFVAATNAEPIAQWGPLAIYARAPQRFDRGELVDNTVQRSTIAVTNKRREMRRYVAQIKVQASLGELMALLLPSDWATRCAIHLEPDVVDRVELWRPHAERQRVQDPDDSMLATLTATRVTWAVHKMPALFSRARDFLILEQHRPFARSILTSAPGSGVRRRQQRGFMRLRHSVPSAPQVIDPTVIPVNAHPRRRMRAKYTRGTMHCSGVVVTEDPAEPTRLRVTVALEVDLFGTMAPMQHRHLMIQRLTRWAELPRLVWKIRMARSGWLLLAPTTSKDAMPVGPCEICVLRDKQVVPQRHAGVRCQCCQRPVCDSCARRHEFPGFLVIEATAHISGLTVPSTTSSTPPSSAAAVSATICVACVRTYSTPHARLHLRSCP